LLSSLLLAIPRPPLPPPSPYTTLFRSQIAHAHRAKLLADHSVTGAEIEDSQRRGGHVVALQLFLQQLADDVGGTAIENVVEQLLDRKSTRLNSSHVKISYAVFCLKKKK